jgi:hypothetical protein
MPPEEDHGGFEEGCGGGGFILVFVDFAVDELPVSHYSSLDPFEVPLGVVLVCQVELTGENDCTVGTSKGSREE